MYLTINELLRDCKSPDAVAIEGVGKASMSYEGLRRQSDKTVDLLHRMGYGKSDRIAVMIPNGPENAVAVLSIGSAFIVAPLNPAYTQKELTFYLSDMRANAIVVPHDLDRELSSFLSSQGVSVIRMTPDLHDSGVFCLDGEIRPQRSSPETTGPEDIAMLLHTSGTTARPKLVPLRQSSVMESVCATIGPLGLGDRDKCLNTMPMFHVHGIFGAVLASLVSGGCVVCAPSFQPELFIGLLKEYRATWYTAVPAVHQHILKEALSRPEDARSTGLRLIRSTSAPLSVETIKGLESVFCAPVIEGYGLTETPHQVTMNALHPGRRKLGSVGLPVAGIEVAILDEGWNGLHRGIVGEVVVKGRRIIRAYENDTKDSETPFKDGWFLTGDLGHLDEDGFLFIDGRIKEIINKSGEKVSPLEIEDALMSHPAVLKAAAFKIPDPSLGENVGAAVVAKSRVEADDLKRHVSGILAYFKVPVKIWVVDSLPTGPTGKLLRVGMYEWLTAKGTPAPGQSYEPPATDTEAVLASIWAEVLSVERVGRRDSFFDIGGDSLRATMAISRIKGALNVRVGIVDVIECDTIERLGKLIDRR